MFNQIKEHLSSNRGDENISKMIWVAIVFVVGAILLLLITSAFNGPIKGWYDHVVDEWFNHENGQFSYFVDNNPDDGGGDGELPDAPEQGVTMPTIPDDDDGPAGGNGGGDWGDDNDGGTEGPGGGDWGGGDGSDEGSEGGAGGGDWGDDGGFGDDDGVYPGPGGEEGDPGDGD